jgi:integrase
MQCANAFRYPYSRLASATGRAKITKADGSPRLNFHCPRHFRASMLIEDGANPKEVMGEMGHSNIAMTYDLYGHLFTDADADTRRAERAERLAGKLMA